MACVTVVNHHASGARRLFEGDDTEVRKELVAAYPWLAQKLGHEASLDVLVRLLNKGQAQTAKLDDGDLMLKDIAKHETPGQAKEVLESMLGFNYRVEAAFEAARFLAGGISLDQYEMRRALAAANEDPEVAALVAYGLDPIADRAALKGVLALPLAKSELEAPEVKSVAPATKDGEAFAAAVTRAIEAEQLSEIHLGSGKHSKGTLLARDPETHLSILLKPGS